MQMKYFIKIHLKEEVSFLALIDITLHGSVPGRCIDKIPKATACLY
jgi:hypothetical protein